MKLDPNNCCVNYKENLLFAIIHDLIAYPLLALTFYKFQFAKDFHNWTSHKAWVRSNNLNQEK